MISYFVEPYILWHILWVIPLMYFVFRRGQRKRHQVLQELLGKDYISRAIPSVSTNRRELKFSIEIIIVVFVVVAAARPISGFRPQPYQSHGSDIVFIFDTSRSMLAADVKPSRISHAQWLVKAIAERFSANRFGLVSFSGRAFIECPLTSDQMSFAHAVDDLSVEGIPLGGTNLELALQAALKALDSSVAGSNALVLITDGGEITGDSGKVIREIKQAGIPLVVVGIGEQGIGSVVVLRDKLDGGIRYLRDKNNEVVLCTLNESLLRELANDANGHYYRSTSENSNLHEFEQLLGSLKQQSYDNEIQQLPIERFQYPLFIAFVLLILWLCISERALPSDKKRNATILSTIIFFTGIIVLPAVRAGEISNYDHYQAASDLLVHDVPSAQKILTEIVSNPVAEPVILARCYFNLAVIAQLRAAEKTTAYGLLKSPDDALKKSCTLALQLADDLYQQAMGFNISLPLLFPNMKKLENTKKQFVMFEKLSLTKFKKEDNAKSGQDISKEAKDEQGHNNTEKSEKAGSEKVSAEDSSDMSKRRELDENMSPELLLETMAADEKKLRLKLKNESRKKYGVPRVEKDW